MTSSAALLGAVVLLCAGSAAATQLDVTYARQSGNVTSSWTQPSTPVVAFYAPGGYTAVDVSNGVEDVYGALTPISIVYFAPAGSLGGYFSGPGVSDFGLGVLYEGPESAPVFKASTFTGALGGTLTFVDAPAAAPEPSTWLLLLGGLAGIGVAVRAGRLRAS